MEENRTIIWQPLFGEKDKKPPSRIEWILWAFCVAFYAAGVAAWLWFR